MSFENLFPYTILGLIVLVCIAALALTIPDIIEGWSKLFERRRQKRKGPIPSGPAELERKFRNIVSGYDREFREAEARAAVRNERPQK